MMLNPNETEGPILPASEVKVSPKIRLSREQWFNPSFLKGTFFFIIGLLVLTVPSITTQGNLHYILAAFLILGGGIDLWGRIRGNAPEEYRKGKLWIAVSLIAGTALLFWPETNLKRLAIFLLVYACFRSGIAFWHALSARRQGLPPPLLVWERAWSNLALAALLLALPMTMLTLLIITASAFAMVAGLLMIIYAVLPHGPDEGNSINHAQFIDIIWKWLQVRDIGQERRAKVAEDLYFENPDQLHKIISYIVMLILSVSIATLAILQDSTAVVIGAMLVAPLMTPIMGCAAGLVAGWQDRIRHSILIIIASVMGSIGLAWMLASWIPELVPALVNSQVMSRVSPTLLDMAIAVVAGAAGAYATIDNRVSSSLTGVAIAVALVPPLGVVGVSLEAGLYSEAFGAFLLFSTNLVSIILVSMLVFILIGFTPIRVAMKGRVALGKIFLTILFGALLIMIPLGITGQGMLEKASWRDKAQDAAEDWIAGEPDLRVQRVRLRRNNSNMLIYISGYGLLPDIEVLEKAIIESIEHPISITVEYFPTVIRRTSPKTDARSGEENPPPASPSQ